MTKKELRKQIIGMQSLFDRKLNLISKEYEAKYSGLQSLIGSQKETIKKLSEVVDDISDREEERWEMLLDYFKLEEKEYAELEEQDFVASTGDIYRDLTEDIEPEKVAVKKTKLVKRK